jgi:transcriptional regulator with XRE-family HTH domain
MNNRINDNILAFNLHSPEAIRVGVAERVKARRLEMNLTQKGMALRASIPVATYRRFEACGEISLLNLILISVVLDMTDDIKNIFSERRYQDIKDVINAEKTRMRKRGRKND